jgi:hypothetical protein
MKLQKAPRSQAPTSKKTPNLQMPNPPSLPFRTLSTVFPGIWDLELFKTPLLQHSTTPFPLRTPKSRRWNHFAAAFVVGIVVTSFPMIPALADRLLMLCRVRGRAGSPRSRHA